jgi:glycosyltransferase involved in cell wall biosynthesis
VSPTIDLIRVTAPPIDDDWGFGTVTITQPSAHGIGAALKAAAARRPDAILVLHGALALPPVELLERLLAGSGDLWHGGLALGNGGRPVEIDYVTPIWMLSLDPDPAIEATSWRLSLHCCLLRPTVVDHLGSPDGAFETLSGAALDFGLHAIRSGVMVRHVPQLVVGSTRPDEPPTAADGLRLIARHHGRRWLRWAAARRIRHRGDVLATLRAYRRCQPSAGAVSRPTPFMHRTGSDRFDPEQWHDRVTVLVPTIDRYPYLRTLLGQLADQTVRPLEVIVVDQTPVDRRLDDIRDWAPDLPVRLITLAEAGQCTSRNAGLTAARAGLILFLDDDDEVRPALIEGHLRILATTDIAASSGGVDDVGAGPPPYDFTYPRVSDVFPTNNTLVRRSALVDSGLFDPAFDRGARADHDLGTRLYLAGALLRFDPAIRLVHLHAPRGGLRTHGSRVSTRASSRSSYTERNLPEVTQLYLWRRYFTDEQVGEAILNSIGSLLGHDGSMGRRLIRVLVQVALLPSSIREVRRNDAAARALLHDRPPIPELPAEPAA